MTLFSHRKTARSISIIAAVVVTFAFTQARAQDGVTATGSNILRFGTGTEGEGSLETRKQYFEEIANARLFWKNLSIGLRYEMDDPSERGRSFQGLRRRWIAYKKDRLELQAGDVTALYGRGLSVNLFESRPLNYDTWLDGFSGAYEFKWNKSQNELEPAVAVRAVGGKLDFYPIDPREGEKPLAVTARSANAEFSIFNKKVALGGSFTQAYTDQGVYNPFSSIDEHTKRQVDQPEVYLDIFSGEFQGFIQWTEPRSNLTMLNDVSTVKFHRGNALYASVSYANEDFGITLEHKNYRYNLLTVDRPLIAPDVFDKLPISNPPEVFKEFVYTSLTRKLHPTNFNDELGYQAEVNLTTIPKVVITLNGSVSSQHTAFIRDSLFQNQVMETASIFPNLKNMGFAPSWEVSGEVEYELGELDYVKFIAHRRMYVEAVSLANPGGSEVFGMTTFAAKVQYETTASQSLLVIAEHQWMHQYPTKDPFLNEMVTAQYSFNPFITFGGIWDFSTDYREPRHIWPQVFASTRIGDSHTVLLSYGAERGGLNCTGGICRIVQPFEGLRFTLTSQL